MTEKRKRLFEIKSENGKRGGKGVAMVAMWQSVRNGV